MRALPTAALLVSFAAWGQDHTLLYVNPAPLTTTSRLVGLGGAAVGTADASESMPYNYAAVAQRHPTRARGFDWDVTLAVLFSPFPALRDVDNEGTTPEIIAPADAQLGGMIQFKRFGLGLYSRASRRGVCVAVPCDDPANMLSANAEQLSVMFGFNAWKDQLVFGIGAFVARAGFELNGRGFSYIGWSAGAGGLFRPHFLPFRIGINATSQANGVPQFDVNMMPTFQGRPVFTGVVSPAKLSIGASARFGPGAWRYNRISMSALREQPEDFNFAEVPHDLEPDDPRPPGLVLVTVQLDIVFPVDNATNLTPFLDPSAPRRAAGASLALVPRFGAELEPFDSILRVRLGGYLEPPFLDGASIRPHITGGVQVFLFHLLMDWCAAGSVDYAARYLAMSVGIGWWS